MSHRFAVRARLTPGGPGTPGDWSDENLGAYATLEEARLWAKRLAFANTCDVGIFDLVESSLLEERRNETEIALDAEQSKAWRADDAALRDNFQRQADRFECAIVLVASDGEHLLRIEPSS